MRVALKFEDYESVEEINTFMLDNGDSNVKGLAGLLLIPVSKVHLGDCDIFINASSEDAKRYIDCVLKEGYIDLREYKALLRTPLGDFI